VEGEKGMRVLNATDRENLAEAVEAAVAMEMKYGVPAQLSAAQWALESGWGHYQPGCNCFGIKQYAGGYGFQTLATHEFIRGQDTRVNQQFATFPSIGACFDYHAWLLAHGAPYQDAWKSFKEKRDADELAVNIAPHYAPGNDKYPDSVKMLMRDPNIVEAITEAKRKSILYKPPAEEQA
jgi:flagellum-specific peptidoglycan hydrolase FlgJ